ncbi:MAG: hypothetical protein LQ345_006497 [Seirophora villosa]|nr:MAG: hypothetical protein LQ345_006497 [Seirophora villosa]
MTDQDHRKLRTVFRPDQLGNLSKWVLFEPEGTCISDYHFIAFMKLYYNYTSQDIASALAVERQFQQLTVRTDGKVELALNPREDKRRTFTKEDVRSIFGYMEYDNHPHSDIYRYWQDYDMEMGESESPLKEYDLYPLRLLLPRFHAAYTYSQNPEDDFLDMTELTQQGVILTGPDVVTDSRRDWNSHETWYKQRIRGEDGEYLEPESSDSSDSSEGKEGSEGSKSKKST